MGRSRPQRLADRMRNRESEYIDRERVQRDYFERVTA
jgi:hypothetical protein